MEKFVAVNQVGDMLVIHMDDPAQPVIRERLQMLLMSDVDPQSLVVFDGERYTVYPGPKDETTHVPGAAWAVPMSFML